MENYQNVDTMFLNQLNKQTSNHKLLYKSIQNLQQGAMQRDIFQNTELGT